MTKTSTTRAALACAALALAASGAQAAGSADRAQSCTQSALARVQSIEAQVRRDRYASWDHFQRRQFEDAAVMAKVSAIPKSSHDPMDQVAEAARVRVADDQSMADGFLAESKAAPMGKDGAKARSAADASRRLWLSIKQADSAVLSYTSCRGVKLPKL